MNKYNDNRVYNEGYEADASIPYIQSAHGCRVTDNEGKHYIDLAMAAGIAILGHACPMVVEAVKKQLELGTVFAQPNTLTKHYIDRILEAVPWFGGAVLCNSGSEATLRAIRLMRAYTGQKKIAVFTGSWHGGHDSSLFDEDYQSLESKPRLVAKSAGIADTIFSDLIALPYNNEYAFQLISSHAQELAGVIIEPIQGSNPRDDIGPFLKKLRTITEEHRIPLCFDEIITGFRLLPGGVQEWFGIHADLATYGKIIGGGFPVGLVAGRQPIMDRIHGNDDCTLLPVFMGGTFSANPVTVRAGLETLNILLDNPSIFTQLNQRTHKLVASLNQYCAGNSFPVYFDGIGSMFRMYFTGQKINSKRQRDQREASQKLQAYFYRQLFDKGIHVSKNRINFLSSAHSLEDIAEINTCIQACLAQTYCDGVVNNG